MRDVKVRLAVGGAAGGKADGRNDGSIRRAFTLHGLRSDRRIPIIAEYEDEDGTMSGRAQVKAPETNVRIALAASRRCQAGTCLDPPGSVANRADLEHRIRQTKKPLEEIDGRSGRRINDEDLGRRLTKPRPFSPVTT